MDLASLQSRIDRYAKVDLAPLYATYSKKGGPDDVEEFLAFLGAARVLSERVLAELHGVGDVDVAVEAIAVAAAAPRATRTGDAPTKIERAAEAPPAASARTLPGGATAPVPVPGFGSSAGPIRFQPISVLGQGAMGAISIARDVGLRRKVALKTVLPEMSQHPALLRRFLAEMQVTAQLEHPNVVPVYALEVGENGALGYAMKLVHGRDLSQLIDEARESIEKGQPLDEDHQLEKRLEIFLKVCDAVDYAHSKGVVHRDLKPSNIMIGRHNEVYLMDWGIARLMGTGGQAFDAGIEFMAEDGNLSHDLGRTRYGQCIGTPPYMSPEQAGGFNEKLDARSDLYSMGLILQECVSLKRAVNGTTLDEVITKARTGVRDPVVVGVGLDKLPREIEAIVRRATQLTREHRYATVGELAADVRRYVNGDAVLALPEGPARRAGRWLAKHRMTALMLVLGLGLAGSLATIGALVVGQRRVEAAHRRELRVSELQAQSAIEAQLVDHDLGRYEEALTEFVGAAQIIIAKAPPGEASAFFDDAFTGKAKAPEDLAPSKSYGKPISVLAPVAWVAPGTEREPVEPILRSLYWLTPELSALLIASSGADAHRMSPGQQRAAIADLGVPAYRAVVALKEGVTLSFPGMAGVAIEDTREAAFYKAAESSTGVKWGLPTTTDKGTILPAIAPLYDEQGEFLGVVRLDVSLDKLLARPGVQKIDYVQSRVLVGRDGKVMAGDGEGNNNQRPIAPEVAAAIAKGESGTREVMVDGHSWQYAYYPLATLDWYYVASGQTERMIESKAKVETSDPRRVIKAAAPPAPSVAPKPPPKPAPPAPVAEEPDAGVEDAGADAGVKPVLGGPLKKPGPMPTAAPSAAPAEAPLPPNPFDKWQVYKKPGKN